MKLTNPTGEIFIPDQQPVEKALRCTTHMGIGAHQDDLEFMSLHGILECFRSDQRWFTGITVTDGRGSSRTGSYAAYTDEQMRQVRRKEQNKAATIGEYAAMASLDYPSSAIKNKTHRGLIEDLKLLIAEATPEFIYTHNLADKHETHIAVTAHVIRAIRELPASSRPKALYGCEVWRNLDWMLDQDKVLLDVSAHKNLGMALMGVFDSQISGGKRYDLATYGRKKANATFLESHKMDQANLLEFAMDLTPLIQNPDLNVIDYVQTYINRFAKDVAERMARHVHV